MALNFNYIPEHYDVWEAILKRTKDDVDDQDVWDIAREYKEIPHMDNILLELTFSRLESSIQELFRQEVFEQLEYDNDVTKEQLNTNEFYRLEIENYADMNLKFDSYVNAEVSHFYVNDNDFRELKEFDNIMSKLAKEFIEEHPFPKQQINNQHKHSNNNSTTLTMN